MATMARVLQDPPLCMQAVTEKGKEDQAPACGLSYALFDTSLSPRRAVTHGRPYPSTGSCKLLQKYACKARWTGAQNLLLVTLGSALGRDFAWGPFHVNAL